MRQDMIEVMDSVEFQMNGSRYRAFIKELRKDGMSVKVVQKDFESSLWGDFKDFMMEINEDMFDDLQLEIWSDGRGCDNSAIGVQGCHEPWNHVWQLAVDMKSNF
jgi:hypothetical protein